MDRSISSFAEASDLVLRTLEAELGASAVWIGHLDEDRSVLRVVAGRGEPSFGLEPGVEAPLESSFCHVMASGGPTIANQVRSDPCYGALPATLLLDVGSFVGAPLRLSDGTAVGTLCAFHHSEGAYSERENRLVSAFAALLARDLDHQRDNADLHDVVDELRVLASTDALTGLANRRSFRSAIDIAWDQDEPATVVLVDVDRLKAINDERGHLAGDAVLAAVSQAMLAASGARDLVARLGGDEFAVLLRDTDVEAWQVAVTDDVARRGAALGVPTGVSIGHVSLLEAVSPQDALASADVRLYDSKRRRALAHHSTRA